MILTRIALSYPGLSPIDLAWGDMKAGYTYEKKKKPVSASSSDIETELEGKRNGTATPQSELYSEGKDTQPLTDKQISEEEGSSHFSENVAKADTRGYQQAELEKVTRIS